jgi:prepilin-type N-terminal cleavage/methylation domain-containing protein
MENSPGGDDQAGAAIMGMPARRFIGFTLVELLVVVAIIALLIGILVPVLGGARTSAKQTISTTHMRGIHQGMVLIANDNRGFFPGIEPNGKRFVPAADNFSNKSGAMVQGRYAILLKAKVVTPDYLISPSEPQPKSPYDIGSGDIFNTTHYSYAMQNIAGDQNDAGYTGLPQINPNKGKYNIREWRQSTANPQAIVLGDRLLKVKDNDFHNVDAYLGPWSESYGDSQWGVAWNDGHVEFARTPFFETNYGGIGNSRDDIFSRPHNIQGNVQSPPGRTNYQSPANCFLAARNAIDIIQ